MVRWLVPLSQHHLSGNLNAGENRVKPVLIFFKEYEMQTNLSAIIKTKGMPVPNEQGIYQPNTLFIVELPNKTFTIACSNLDGTVLLTQQADTQLPTTQGWFYND